MLFKMLNLIASYFWKNEKENLNADEVFSMLTSNDNEDESNETNESTTSDNNYTCIQKIGYITNIDEDEYEIDGKYVFRSENKFDYNTRVSYVLHKEQSDDMFVSNVKPCENEWDNEDEKYSTWCIRSLVCKVIKRDCRNLLLSPDDIWIDLNSCSIDFLPMIGDWLTIEAKCMIDEEVSDLNGKVLEIIQIKPLRHQILEGIIRQWNDTGGEGIINQDVYFNSEALTFGYIPAIKDKIVTEIIESDQCNCNWRALKILPGSKSDKNADEFNKMIKYVKNVNADIVIPETISLQIDNADTHYNFDVYVTNKSDKDILLLNVVCYSNNQLTSLRAVNKMVIPANSDIPIEFLYNFNGRLQHGFNLITFIFNDFKLTTHLFLTCDNSSENQMSRDFPTRNNTQNYDLIKGQRLTTAARFKEIKLPDFPLPSKLQQFVYNHVKSKQSYALLIDELGKMKPSLKLPLSYNIYEDKFHTLLHLQEIKTLIDMEQYNMERACFVRNGEYLLLEVENLSERRPSIVTGDKIMVHDPKSKLLYEGFVHKVGAKHVYLKFSQIFHNTYNNEDYMVTVEISRSNVRRMHQAVSSAIRKLGRDFLFPTKVTIKKPQLDFTYDQYYDNITSSKKRMSSARLIELLKLNKDMQNNAAVQADDDSKQTTKSKLLLEPTENGVALPCENKITERLKLEWFNKNLNYYQKEAVRNILIGEARPLPYIIFGPPGTGKTITIIETILQIMTMIPQSRILVATPSNSAADLIATRLINSNLLKPGDLIRLVSFKLVQDDAVPLNLIPFSATLNMGREGTIHPPKTLTNGLTLGCGSAVVGRHRITVGTCSTIGGFHHYSLPKGHFTHIIIDEAGQAMEPEIMIPISLLDISTGQVILAGDPLQLGPVVSSTPAVHFGLQESFLERFLNRFPYTRDIEGFKITGGYDPRLVTKLIYNYRSLPETLDVYNKLFYNSDLKATISPTNSPEADLLFKVKEILPVRDSTSLSEIPSVVFHGIIGENYQTSDSPSWYNPDEASCVFDYVNNLYRLGISCTDIGIITPYTKQVKYLRTIFTQAEFQIPKIGSIEEFQGQECNIILLSTVRSQSKYVSSDVTFNLGFISNPRRVNVALSRAKCLTIIIGNPNLLSMDSTWRGVLLHCIEKQSYHGCELNDA